MSRTASGRSAVTGYLPGLAALGAIALISQLVADALAGVSPLVVAVAVGALVGNTLGTPRRLEAGVATHSFLLEIGIVLLGVSLSVADLVAAGPTLAALAVVAVAVGLVTVEALSRVAGIRKRTGSLLAAGASICGVSAIAAVASSFDADEGSVAYAAATVLLFDAVTLALFPAVGHALDMSQRVFGIWAGLAMFSTGPVTAAGFAYGDVAGQWATVTKLARNTLIGVVALAYSLAYASGEDEEASDEWTLGGVARRLAAGVPAFLVGFLALAALTNLGAFSGETVAAVERVSSLAFLLAFAGLGFDLRLARLRETGGRPIAVVAASLLVVSTLAFVAVTSTF